MDCITLEIVRRINEPWGIQISGESPCYIDCVKDDSPAALAGIREGDCIFGVNGSSVHDAKHEEVVDLIATSERVVRFRILPVAAENDATPTEDAEGGFWTDDVITERVGGSNTDSEDDSDDSEHSFGVQSVRENMSGLALSPSRAEDIRLSPNHHDHIEQSKFIITREDQKHYDKNALQDCTFKGTKASVAGAFTGDHNVITDGKDSNDVRGVRARVKAGIQHFSFDEEQEKINPEDKGKIIVYTTSLGIFRSVANQCEQVRKILEGYRVKYEVRDVFNFPEFKDELYTRLGLADGDPFPDMPRVYIEGVYMGGGHELQEMSDCGDLRIRLREYPKYNIRSKCPTCQGTGMLVCHSCKGKAFRRKNRFALLKCATCRQKGTLDCTDCRE